MTVELMALITIISVGFAIFSGIANMKRNHKTDIKSDSAELTTVIVKLENIGTGITEIKSEMNNMKNEVQDSRERLVKVEESSKQAHKRIDELMAERSK